MAEPSVAPTERLHAIDVRPMLSAGIDPLEAILGALAVVVPGGLLRVTAPFEPKPLFRLLTARGHRVEARRAAADRWEVDVVVDGSPPIEDLSQLEPPEPLERALLGADGLAPGETYLARVPRFPSLLLPRLQQRGLHYAVHQELDDSALLCVWRAE